MILGSAIFHRVLGTEIVFCSHKWKKQWLCDLEIGGVSPRAAQTEARKWWQIPESPVLQMEFSFERELAKQWHCF